MTHYLKPKRNRKLNNNFNFNKLLNCDASWVSQKNLPPKIKLAIQRLKECLDPQKPPKEICMNIVEDLLFKDYEGKIKKQMP